MAAESAPSHRVYVGNLAYSVTADELGKAFNEAGDVKAAIIITRGTRPLGFAFVEYDTADLAQKAVEIMNGKELGSRVVKVELARPQVANADRPARKPRTRKPKTEGANVEGGEGAAAPSRRRQPRKAPAAAAAAEGAEGEASPKPKRERAPRKPKVIAEGGETAAPKEGEEKPRRAPRRGPKKTVAEGEAQVEGETKPRRGRNPRPHRPEDDIPSNTMLFVTNLPYAVTNEILASKFASIKIKSAHVVNDRFGRSKGFGFVEAVDQENQIAGRDQVNGTDIDGRSVVVKIGRLSAERKAEESA